MKLLSVNVGLPQVYHWKGKEVQTAIFKTSIPGPTRIHPLGVDGDKVANEVHHGGIDKAVFAFGFDDYPWWCQKLGIQKIEMGAFGENLTFSHLDEEKIFVGDQFELGTAVVQAVQPRSPCFKLEVRFNNPELLKIYLEHGRPGVYFRVLKEGLVKAGDELNKISEETVKCSILELYKIHVNKSSLEKSRALELLKVPSMTEQWKKKILDLSR